MYKFLTLNVNNYKDYFQPQNLHVQETDPRNDIEDNFMLGATLATIFTFFSVRFKYGRLLLIMISMLMWGDSDLKDLSPSTSLHVSWPFISIFIYFLIITASYFSWDPSRKEEREKLWAASIQLTKRVTVVQRTIQISDILFATYIHVRVPFYYLPSEITPTLHYWPIGHSAQNKSNPISRRLSFLTGWMGARPARTRSSGTTPWKARNIARLYRSLLIASDTFYSHAVEIVHARSYYVPISLRLLIEPAFAFVYISPSYFQSILLYHPLPLFIDIDSLAFSYFNFISITDSYRQLSIDRIASTYQDVLSTLPRECCWDPASIPNSFWRRPITLRFLTSLFYCSLPSCYGIHFWRPALHGLHFWCPISTWQDPLLVARSSWAALLVPHFYMGWWLVPHGLHIWCPTSTRVHF